MARVNFDPFPQRGISNTPLPAARVEARAGAFGADEAAASERLGDTMLRAGNQLMDAAIVKQKLTNEISATETDTWLTRQVTDKWSQYGRTEGKAAQEALPQFKADIDGIYQEALKNAPSPEMKAQLTKSGAYITNTYYKSATRHADQELTKWQNNTAVARAGELGNQAVLNVNEPEVRNTFLIASDNEIRKIYETRGWDEEAISGEVAKNRGRNLKAMIETKAAEDPMAAVSLFKEYSKDMDAGSRVATSNYLRPILTKQAGRELADEELGRAPQGGVRLPGALNNEADAAASAAGIDPTILKGIIRIESGGNPNAVKGSYKGLGQMSDALFQQYGGGDIFNPRDNLRATAKKLADESRRFEGKYGRAPNAAELYLMHQQGEGGFDAHNANPDRPAWQNMASTAEGKQKGDGWAKLAIWGNVPDSEKAKYGSVENITSRQFMDLWARKVAANVGGALPDKTVAFERIIERTKDNPALQDAALQQANRIYTTYEREQARTSTQAGENYERSIIDAGAGISGLPPRADIETDQRLTDTQRNTLLRQYDTAAKDVIKIANANTRFEKGEPFNAFDPDDKKAADQIYKKLGGDTTALDAVVSKTGILPKTASIAMRADLISNNPVKVATAMGTASNLLAKNPNIFVGIDGKSDLENNAVAFRHYVDDLGMSAQEAGAKIVREQSPEYQASVKAKIKGEDVDAEIRKRVSVGDLASAFDQMPWVPFTDPNVGFDPASRSVMFSQYAEQVKERYLETGDWSVAKKQAAESLKKTWGVSTINGKNTVMQYPPERAPAYAGLSDPGTLIATQAIDAIKLEAGTEVKRQDIRLMPIPAITAEAYKTGKPVPYQLTWADKDGIIQMLNPGHAFVADPQALRTTQSNERRAALETARAGMEPGFARQDYIRQNLQAVREGRRDRILADRAASENAYAGN